MSSSRLQLASMLFLAFAPGCWEVPATVPELGPLSMPAVVTGRDGGSAAMVNGRMLWTFNDTLMTVFGIDGFSYRPTTAGWADGTSTQLAESLDSNGAPYQLVPYTDEEISYNRSHGPNDRFAMWPNAVVANGPDTALVFFAYLHVFPGTYNYVSLGAGVAQIRSGQTVGVRQPALLFSNPEPAFQAGSIVVDGFLYLYACTTGNACPVARAPLAQATTHVVGSDGRRLGHSGAARAALGLVERVSAQLPRRLQPRLLERRRVLDGAGPRRALECAEIPVHGTPWVEHQLRGAGASRALHPRRPHAARQLRRRLGGVRERDPAGHADAAVGAVAAGSSSPS